MRTDKELIAASKEFTGDNPTRSWLETLFTLALAIAAFVLLLQETFPLLLRIGISILCGLLYVRLFVIYHDFQHRAILQNSRMANIVLNSIGAYLLAPENIWKRSHEHHHNHNSKLSIHGIGSYPTICKNRFASLTPQQKRLYLINRHPLTVIFGYFTLFIYWLNLRSFVQSSSKHWDSLAALIFHAAAGTAVAYFFGPLTFVLAWFFPFFLAFAMGSYLFYCQHNFPGAKFREDLDWRYVHAAMESTSQMMMNPVMQWFTANIGYHQVHHLNSRIPFYRLKEALEKIPELQNAPKTSWSPFEMARCFRLKMWDADQDRMITLEEYQQQAVAAQA